MALRERAGSAVLVPALLVLAGSATPAWGRSHRHRQPVCYHPRTKFISTADVEFETVAAKLPGVALNGWNISDGADVPETPAVTTGSHGRSRRQSGSGNVCPSPPASATTAWESEIMRSTTWSALPDPQTGGAWVSWARDTQEEMLITIPRPMNGDNRHSVWLSTDAGATFSPIALPSGFPNNVVFTKCFYGNANQNGGFNAYCLLDQPSSIFGTPNTNYIGVLFSSDGGTTWSVKTTRTAPNAQYPLGRPVPVDYFDLHPTVAGAFLAHYTIDSSLGLYRTYFGQVGSDSNVVMHPLTPNEPNVQPPTQVLAWWAGWSKGGPNAMNTVYIMAQETPTTAPANGMALRYATVTFGASASATVPTAPIIPDLYDFTQVGNFSVAEVTIPHAGTQGGFNETALKVSTDGMNFADASLPVGPTELAEYFEVVDATEGQVTLAAQHSTARLQGEVSVQVTFSNGSPSISLNASRAVFSDTINSTDPSTPTTNHPAVIFDPTNPWGCNSSWNIQTQLSQAGGSDFYVVVRRGNYAGGPICYFAAKLENAFNAGASGVIIVNNQPSSGRPNLYMVAPEGYNTAQFSTLPCVIVSRTEGESLISALTQAYGSGGSATGQITEDNLQSVKLWQYTSLYISQGGLPQFTRSLLNVVYVTNNNVEYVDVYAVASMGVDPAFSRVATSGTYLANTRSGGTLVSTNKGATWTPCTLTTTGGPLLIVLDTLSAQRGWSEPLSVISAPGLVVANAADSTNPNYIQPTTHISRDGGLTWTPAVTQPDSGGGSSGTQPYLYEILDHGSVVVLVETTSQSSIIWYSLDEGDSWFQFHFYNATTLLGRWQDSATSTVFECYPVFVQLRPSPATGAGFTLVCTSITNRALNLTIDVPTDSNGFSNWADGVASAATVTASSLAQYPAGTHVVFNNAANTVSFPGLSGSNSWVRPTGSLEAHNVRFLDTITNFRATATQMFAYWYQRTAAGNSIIGLRIDFGAPLTTSCSTASYEPFRLVGANNTCYMGANASIQRRQQCTVCRQTENGDALTTQTDWHDWQPCPCRTQDYACSFGYRRVNNIQANGQSSTAEPCTQDTDVPASSDASCVYFRVPGDQCRGNIPLECATAAPTVGPTAPPGSPTSPPTPPGGHQPTPPGGHSKGGKSGGSGGGGSAAVIVVVIIVLGVVGGGGFYAYKTGRCHGVSFARGGQRGPRYVGIQVADADDVPADSDSDEADDDLIDASNVDASNA